MRHFLYLLSIIIFPMFVFSQTALEKEKITKNYNVEELKEIANSLQFKAELEKVEALRLAKQNDWLVTIEEDGKFSELMKVSKEGTPLYYSTFNINAAKSTRANTLHNGGILGLNVEGQNMEAHVWDAGLARTTHQEYDGAGGNNRFSIGDGTSALHYHSAHVTGTIIASGYVASAKGMAPQADAIGYDWDYDVSEATTAAGNGMLLSNHSYGWNIDYVQDWQFGAYASDSRDWDVVMNAAPYYLMVVAAGNEGNDNTSNGAPLDGNSSYDKLSGHSTTKNNLVVANAQDANIDANGNLISVSINTGSSEGPTDDYRIKPDITGNGTGLYSTFEDANNSYYSISGTSMASPNVCGTLLLLQQHYNNLNSGFMRAATLKGLALHTADDAGPSGPDAVWGWGLLNAKRAANTISNNGVESTISEVSLSQSGTYQINVDSDGINDLVASISWNDPAGTANSGTVNNNTPVLVNDLDIRVTKGGSTYYPYKLTSITTNGTGDNLVDPYEKVIISGASGTYTISISHKGSLSGGNQNFSLIITGQASTPAIPIADFSADDVNPNIGQTVNFSDLSANIPTSWSWSFNPNTITYVSGTNSSSQFPKVTFNTIDTYTVTLTATNTYGSDDEVKTNYINTSYSSTETYTSGDIPTDFNFQSLPGSSSCPGILTVNIPVGATITGVDVAYEMSADGSNSAWMSEQRSQLRCITTGGTNEGILYEGSGDIAGTFTYNRTALNIANGVTGGGIIEFELHAGRSWGGSGCNTTYNQVDNNTWEITVYYTPPAIAPVADFSADDVTPNIGQTVTFTDASTNIPTSWAWSFNPATVSYVNGTSSSSQDPQVTFDAIGLYTVSLIATNASGSDTETKTDYIDVPFSYCSASGATSYLEITRVQLETIDNSTGQNYYADYTYLSTDLIQNQSYDITITNGDNYQNADVGIWIDWNQNGNLNDAGENIVCEIDDYGEGTFNFNVPSTALSGVTLMRIRTKFDGSDCGNPCGTTSYGEVEDYSVNIIVVSPGLWTGTTSTDWGTSTNWDDGNLPTLVTNVIIPTTPSGGNFPEINSGAGAVCNNLFIESGAHLYIPSNNTLTVSGSLTNSAGTNGLVIESDNSGMGSLIHSTSGVQARVEQYLSSERWHLVSPPVAGATINTYFDIYLKEYNEDTDTWTYLFDPTTMPMNVGQGYSAWASDAYTGSTTVDFQGTLNSSDVNIGSLDYTSGAAMAGFNLVGNPFACALDWNTNWNTTNMSGWAVVYDNGVSRGVHTDGTFWMSKTNSIIPSTQGFWVRALNGSANLTIPASERVHNNQAFYKDTKENTYPEIRLNMEINGFSDEAAIMFHPEATDGFDGYYDLHKFENVAEAPQLFTIASDGNYAFNFYGPEYAEKIIPVGFRTEEAGLYTITASSIENFDNVVGIYLEDLITGSFTDLTNTPEYEFGYDPQDEEHRFNLHFTYLSVAVDENAVNSIRVYSADKTVFINNPDIMKGYVSIYNMIGKEIYHAKLQPEQTNKITLDQSLGYYLVKVNTNTSYYSEKILIK